MPELPPTGMNEEVDRQIQGITENIRPQTGDFSIATQQADIDGVRKLVDITTSNGGFSEKSVHVLATENPTDANGRTNPFMSRPIGEIGQTIEHDGSVRSRATANTSQGEYFTVQSPNGSRARVEREGYGSVEIKNPRAQVLIAEVAGRAIRKTQFEIQDVKGRELDQDRKWTRSARRIARRAARKKVA